MKGGPSRSEPARGALLPPRPSPHQIFLRGPRRAFPRKAAVDMRRGRAILPLIHISRTAARWISVTGSAKGSSSITMKSPLSPSERPALRLLPGGPRRVPGVGTQRLVQAQALRGESGNCTMPCICSQGLREPGGQSDEPTIIPLASVISEDLSRACPRGELVAVTGDEPLVQPRETRSAQPRESPRRSARSTWS